MRSKTRRKDKLLLPQGYLSPSQVSLWLTDRERYIDRYMFRERRDITNAGIEYGKKMSEAWEAGSSDDDLTQLIISLTPKYDKVEHEIRVDLPTKGGVIPLLGRLDTFDSKTSRFRERKTGMVPWTQTKAQKSIQMHFYAMLVYLKHKKLLPEAHLDWVPTEYDDNGEVVPTGEPIETFTVTFTLASVLETMALCSRVAKEISEEYRKQIAVAFR